MSGEFIDIEWNEAAGAEAENSNEKPIYYRCEMYNGGTRIKFYKPSIAKLKMKRTNLKLIPIEEVSE